AQFHVCRRKRQPRHGLWTVVNNRPESISCERKTALSPIDEPRGVGHHWIFIIPLLGEMDEAFCAGEVCCAIGVEGLIEQRRNVTGIALQYLAEDLARAFGVSSLL